VVSGLNRRMGGFRWLVGTSDCGSKGVWFIMPFLLLTYDRPGNGGVDWLEDRSIWGEWWWSVEGGDGWGQGRSVREEFDQAQLGCCAGMACTGFSEGNCWGFLPSPIDGDLTKHGRLARDFAQLDGLKVEAVTLCKEGFDLVSDLEIPVWGNIFQQEGFEIISKIVKGRSLRRGEIRKVGVETLEMEPHVPNFITDGAIHILISVEELCSLMLVSGGRFISKAIVGI